MSGWGSWGSSSKSSDGGSGWGASSSSSDKKSGGGWGDWGSGGDSKKKKDSWASSGGWGAGSSSSAPSGDSSSHQFFKKRDLLKDIPKGAQEQFVKFDERTLTVKREAEATRDTLRKIESLPRISAALKSYQNTMCSLMDRMDQYERELQPFYEDIKQEYTLANQIESELSRQSYGTAADGSSGPMATSSWLSGGFGVGGAHVGGGAVMADSSSSIELPPRYYWHLLKSFEERLAAMRKCVRQVTEEMQELEQMAGISSIIQPTSMLIDSTVAGGGPAEGGYSSKPKAATSELHSLVCTVQSVFRASVNLASQVACFHAQTEKLKKAYAAFRKQRYGDSSDHFYKTRMRQREAVASLRTGAAAIGGLSADVSSLLAGGSSLSDYETTQAQTLKLSGLQAFEAISDRTITGAPDGDSKAGKTEDSTKADSSSTSAWGSWGDSKKSEEKKGSPGGGFTFAAGDSKSGSSWASSSFSW